MAAKWFEETWTGEHGNYTNASAGYVGTNKSAGLESHWKYMRHDTIGSAGSNRRLSLAIFAPSLVKYVRDTSEKHADKVLDSKSGIHKFPSVPTITTELWNAVQKFDVARLALSTVDGCISSQEQWDHEIYFFHPPDQEIEESQEASASPLSITQKISDYRAAGRKIGLARSAILGVLMPSTKAMKQMRHKFKLTGFTTDNLTTMATHLLPLREKYLDLFHRTAEWNTKHADVNVDMTLDILETFERYCSSFSLCVFSLTYSLQQHRIAPLKFKCGQMLFTSTTRECFSSFVSAETVVMSMLFQPELTVPAVDSKVQLKGRVKAAVANPFNAAALRAKEKKAIEKVEQMWNPTLQVLSGAVAEDSAAGCAARSRVKAKDKVCSFLFCFNRLCTYSL